MGPLNICVCVCLREREMESFSCLYFGELECRSSVSLFPTNQVLPTCQPRRDARPFKTTLLINKPPMHPLRFYSASTSAIETPEKKNKMTLSSARVDPLASYTSSVDVCCAVCVHQSKKVRSKFFTSFSL